MGIIDQLAGLPGRKLYVSADKQAYREVHYLEAVHTEDLEGTDELKGRCLEDVRKGNVLRYPRPWGGWCEFRVDSVKRAHRGGDVAITDFTAINRVSELYGEHIELLKVSGTPQKCLNTLMAGSAYKAGTATTDNDDDFATGEFEFRSISRREALAQLQEYFGTEFEAYRDASGDLVVNLAERGASASSKHAFELADDMSAITYEETSDEIITDCWAFGANIDTATLLKEHCETVWVVGDFMNEEYDADWNRYTNNWVIFYDEATARQAYKDLYADTEEALEIALRRAHAEDEEDYSEAAAKVAEDRQERVPGLQETIAKLQTETIPAAEERIEKAKKSLDEAKAKYEKVKADYDLGTETQEHLQTAADNVSQKETAYANALNNLDKQNENLAKAIRELEYGYDDALAEAYEKYYNTNDAATRQRALDGLMCREVSPGYATRHTERYGDEEAFLATLTESQRRYCGHYELTEQSPVVRRYGGHTAVITDSNAVSDAWLLSLAKQYVTINSEPVIGYEIDVADYEALTGLSVADIALGDRITVTDPDFWGEVTGEDNRSLTQVARVSKRVFNLRGNTSGVITTGTVRSSLLQEWKSNARARHQVDVNTIKVVDFERNKKESDKASISSGLTGATAASSGEGGLTTDDVASIAKQEGWLSAGSLLYSADNQSFWDRENSRFCITVPAWDSAYGSLKIIGGFTGSYQTSEGKWISVRDGVFAMPPDASPFNIDAASDTVALDADAWANSDSITRIFDQYGSYVTIGANGSYLEAGSDRYGALHLCGNGLAGYNDGSFRVYAKKKLSLWIDDQDGWDADAAKTYAITPQNCVTYSEHRISIGGHGGPSIEIFPRAIYAVSRADSKGNQSWYRLDA